MNMNATIKLKVEAIKIEAKMNDTLNTYVIIHTVQCQSNITDLRQEMRTELLLCIQLEKSRLKDKFIAEITSEKDIILMEMRLVSQNTTTETASTASLGAASTAHDHP